MKNLTTLPHPKYRSDIDGLRGIAVLAVVGFHAFPSRLKGGYMGVDIFFIISGYLISSIIGSAQESVRRPDFGGFCLRAGIGYSPPDARQRLDAGIGVAGLQSLPA